MIRQTLITALALAAMPASADPQAIRAFTENCFSPYMTAAKAADLFGGMRHDFYDLRPFSDVPPSPATDPAPGTDRRCEVSFDGDSAADAAKAVLAALDTEGITDAAPLPARYTEQPGTEALAARYLNPNRIAVVHVGTRPGPNGTETFMNVERLTPLQK